jgi:outer membrane lipoprotein SlyB
MTGFSRALAGLAVLALLAGCANKSGETYSANEVNRTAVVTHGTIVGIREVPVQGTSGGTGTMVGAIGGGVAGSFIGGDWRSNVLAGLAGALIGGVVGNQAERAIGSGTATEFTVREEDGQTIAVVQRNDGGLMVGDKVRILRSDKTRLVRETG